MIAAMTQSVAAIISNPAFSQMHVSTLKQRRLKGKEMRVYRPCKIY